MKKRSWKIAGINFDHFHMGDLLRYAHEHPNAEIVGISDEQPARMEEAVRKGLVTQDQAFTDYKECLEKTKPDVVLL
jgi:glucose-fructose oxidoreductase